MCIRDSPRRITLDKIETYFGAKGFADAFDPHMRTSNFYDKWSSLCKKNKKDPKDVLKELGLAGVYDKRWKMCIRDRVRPWLTR